MREAITLAVYGTFKTKDIRIKLFGRGTEKYAFQNILIEAGYDCELFSITDQAIEEATKED